MLCELFMENEGVEPESPPAPSAAAESGWPQRLSDEGQAGDWSPWIPAVFRCKQRGQTVDCEPDPDALEVTERFLGVGGAKGGASRISGLYFDSCPSF